MKKFLLSFYLVLANAQAANHPSLDIKNIHGKFARIQVVDVSNFRTQVTGLIYDMETEATCTGTLIGPRHVLTAAHCVYEFDEKSWTKGLRFVRGISAKTDDITKNTVDFKRIFVQREYIETMKEDFDFALIELDTDVGNDTGWAGFRALRKEESVTGTTMPITFSGYPGDKDFGTLWSVTCPGTVKGKFIYYLCDSFGGMSGSSLFQENDSENYVIGVHTWGGKDKNGGVLINSKNYTLIDQWKNSSEYSPNTIVHSKK